VKKSQLSFKNSKNFEAPNN